MTHLKNPVQLGQIGAPHGITGEVRIKSFTDNPLALSNYGPLYDDKGRQFDIEKLRPAKNVIIARLKQVKTREDAEALNGVKLFIERDQLPADLDDDEFYQADLIGLHAHDDKGNQCGTVVAFYNFGAGDLLEIRKKNGKQSLIPFSLAAVPEVDIEKGIMIIDPIAAGLNNDDEKEK